MTEVWLSRIRLRRDAGLAALGPVLLPEGADARAAMAHRLVWTLFGDDPGRDRDFLWREEAPGRFLALSVRRPPDGTALFEVESKPFAPALAAGDRLAFLLRANATVAPTRGDRRRSDVVMHALRDVPGDERAARRPAIIREAGAAWLARQGLAHGFAPDLERLVVDGYETRRLPREAGSPIRFAVLEFAGVLTVTEPESFLRALPRGFGRARAFGCGLMLIRRA